MDSHDFFYRALFALYVLVFTTFDAVLFMIASFYNKKFGRKTTLVGFTLSIVLLIVAAVMLLTDTSFLVRSIFIITSAFLCAGNGIVLYINLRGTSTK